MKCEVFCCPNKRRKTRGKSFFRFPRDQETSDLWLKEIGREGAVINDNRFVCEDHFEDTYIFQWKDRKVIDKEATPFHDYRACPICSDPNKNEDDVHPGRRKRNKQEKPKKVESNPRDACSSGLKSDNVVLLASQGFGKEEMEDHENFLDPELLEYSASLSESESINFMERIKGICRICLANYFKGQSLFLIYKKKYLPHIVYNLTGNLNPYNNINLEDITQEEIEWAQTYKGCSTSSIYSDDERVDEFCEKQNLKEVITSLKVDPLKCEIEEIPAGDICKEHTNNVVDIKPETVEIIDSADENSAHNTYEEHENVAQKNRSSPHKMTNCVEYIQGSCRVCLTNCFNGQSIFKYYKKKFLPNIILILTGIHVTKGDELPSMICFSCANLLLQAESIRNMCLTSDKFLTHQKEFKIKMESFHNEVSRHKINLEERFTEYPSINFCRDTRNNSTQMQNMPGIDHMGSNVIKEEIQSDIEVKEVFQDQVHCDERFEETAEDHHHNVEKLDNDIEDQHYDEERLEEENEDQHQGKEILDEVKADQLSNDKYENEAFRLNSEFGSFDDDFGGKAFEIFKCNICSKQFEDTKLFDRHRRTHIQKQRKCPVCPKELTYRAMKLHLATHKEINKLICDQCGDVFNNVLLLFNHLRQHKTNVKGNATYVYRCEMCEYENVALSAYQTHMKNMHGLEDPKPFKCKQCQMGFTRKTAMHRHIDNVHNQNPANRVKNFLCNICGKNFYVKFHLKIHMRSHTGERPHKCKYCRKAFTQLSALRSHEYIHTGEKPFACKHCGKKFKQYGHLTYHQQTHAEGFPYICKICNHKFKIKTNLNIHMKLHSKKEFSCKICQKAYVWPCKLKQHFRKSHPGVQVSELEETLELFEES